MYASENGYAEIVELFHLQKEKGFKQFQTHIKQRNDF